MRSRPEVRSDINIGEAARLTGVSAKMIRHYESLGLLPAAPRTEAGYRLYDHDAVHTLHFIRRARDLGFSIEDIGHLLDLWRNRRRPSASVRKLAQHHVQALQDRIDALESMKRTLTDLVDRCHGDERACCPILDDLAGGPSADAD
jgi:Cu(I)-responsive transcriptional regulator